MTANVRLLQARTKHYFRPVVQSQPIQTRYFLHGLFWSVYAAFWLILMVSTQSVSFLKATVITLTLTAGYAVFVYLNLLRGIPLLLWKGRYLEYIAFFAVLVLANGLVMAYLIRAMASMGLPVSDNGKLPLAQSIAIAAFVLFVTTSLKMLKISIQSQQRNKSLETEKLQSELNFLKTQVNPHFLFNTLNNLYSLTLTKSDEAPEIVLKLSAILRYMLYECNDRMVFLNKEIEYLQNYIELESIRNGSGDHIHMTVEGMTDRKMIAPLLFTPLLENAIKHGIKGTTQDSWVDIKIAVSQDRLKFQIENSKPATKTPRPAKSDGGIGLVNVKRRLDLIYPDHHTFRITETPDTFSVSLNLDLVE